MAEREKNIFIKGGRIDELQGPESEAGLEKVSEKTEERKG